MKKVKKIKSFLPNRDYHEQQYLGGCLEKGVRAAQDSSGVQEFLQKWSGQWQGKVLAGKVLAKVMRSVARKSSQEKFLHKWSVQWQEKVITGKVLEGKVLAKVIRSVAKKTNTSKSKISDIISSINKNIKPSISRIGEKHFFWRVIFLNQHPQGIRQLCKFLTSWIGPLSLFF